MCKRVIRPVFLCPLCKKELAYYSDGWEQWWGQSCSNCMLVWRVRGKMKRLVMARMWERSNKRWKRLNDILNVRYTPIPDGVLVIRRDYELRKV